jgi:hypothetical protein
MQLYFYFSKTFDRVSYFRCHQLAHMQKKKGIDHTLEIIIQLLDLPISINHINLCKTIVSQVITLPLPKPNTTHVKSLIAGPEIARTTDKMIPGCYCLYCKNDKINDCYVEQSMHLGNRFKRHAKGQELSTCYFIKSLDDKGVVDLFIIPKTINLYGLKN